MTMNFPHARTLAQLAALKAKRPEASARNLAMAAAFGRIAETQAKQRKERKAR